MGKLTGNEHITVAKLHTDEMMADELKSMLGASKVHLTLGAFASLAVLKSPYVHGGLVNEEALAVAMEMVPHDEMSPVEFHDELQKELDTAFRVWDTIQPDDQPTGGKHSEILMYSPEWFSDIIASACQSMPSLTYEQVLQGVPLVMLMHLAVSTSRRNGALTARPNDIGEAIKQFKEMRAK